MVLDRAALFSLLRHDPPLVEGGIDLTVQLQANGVDLTVREVAIYTSGGIVDFLNRERVLAETKQLAFPPSGLHLAPGAYLVTFNEVVHIPRDIAALGRTRSTLLRCGAALHTAVWDAGYSGRSQSLLTVYNPHGIVLKPNARIIQLVFFRLEQPVPEGYAGRYQGENVSALQAVSNVSNVPQQRAGLIYILVTPAVWERASGAPEYRTPSLENEGFVHASASLEQVLWVANRIYPNEPRLVVLCLDRARIRPPVKDEMTSRGEGPFPHVYGPVNLDALVEVRELARSEGRWVGWG